MDSLKEIANVLTRYQVRQVDVISNPEPRPSKKESRYWEAYIGLRENKWPTDQDFAAHFGLNYPGKSYNRFKNELKDKLWNTLLFTKASERDYNEHVQVYQDLLQKWSVAEILRLRSATKAFIELSGSCLAIAIDHEMSKQVIDITTQVKTHCLTKPHLKKEFQKAKNTYNIYWPIFLAEENLRNAYEEFVSDLAFSKGFKKGFAPRAEAIVSSFSAEFGTVNTVQFHYWYRILHLFSFVLKHDWVNALKVSEEALNFFHNKPRIRPFHIISFNNQKAACLLMLGNYSQCRQVLDHALSYTAPFSSHYYKNRELATVNALYAEAYPDAWELCKRVFRQEGFTFIPLIDQESWRIYYGYLQFLVQIQKLEISEGEKGELPKFRLSSLLNDLPLYSRDKRGAQIPVLILQVLFLFAEHRWDEMDSRIEALRKFRQRNLDPHDEHYRTNCFLNLLELLPKHAHNMSQLEKRAAPILEKMAGETIDARDRTFEIEVIPYERQWEWIMEIAMATKGTF